MRFPAEPRSDAATPDFGIGLVDRGLKTRYLQALVMCQRG